MKVVICKHPHIINYNGIVIVKTNYNTSINYIKNGLVHREDGNATKYLGGGIGWYYKGNWYGSNDRFTIKSWKQQIHIEKLKIFK